MGGRWMRRLTLRVLYPLAMLAGSLRKDRKESYQQFIIDLNNRFVTREHHLPRKILLLLPHCLQINECDIRLTYNIHNCKGCGRCEIKDLISLAEEYHLELFVATGGSLARRIIAENKPDAIVAVACENDLSSGISDTYPLPVLGITNERPFGPCVNTRVDMNRLREAIKIFGSAGGGK
jgi:uncharacterized protein